MSATFIKPSWARVAKQLPDGRLVAVVHMIYTWRLTVGPADAYGYDDGWCYPTEEDAIVALVLWDGMGEPTGWHRHPRSGRRRPEGDPAREYVNP